MLLSPAFRLAFLWTHREVHFCLLALVSFIVIFAKLHLGDLSGYDDAVYAHEGRAMLLSGDWWNVRLNGRLDFDKPPLFIWLEAASMWLFGVSDWAAKFPAALLGWGTILLSYFVARELRDEYWLPVWTMLVLLTTQFFLRYAMHAMTDVPFAFFFTLALLGYLKALRQPRYWCLCGTALCAALMLRSILGLLPLGVIMLHLVWQRRFEVLCSGHFVGGLLCAFSLPLAWFGSQYWWHGADFFARHFAYSVENVPQMEKDGVPRLLGGLFQYPWLLLQYYWPWLPLALYGLVKECRRSWCERAWASQFLILWVLGVVTPLSLLQIKYLRYLMPVFPALAVLAAMALLSGLPMRYRPASLKLAYAVLCLGVFVLAVNPKYRQRPEEMRRLAVQAEAVTPASQHILFYMPGNRQEEHLYQVIWYANRLCQVLPEPGELLQTLNRQPESTAIVDRHTFQQLIDLPADDLEILGQTESFVCFRRSRLQVAKVNPLAAGAVRLVASP